jgi:hypothetical protein
MAAAEQEIRDKAASADLKGQQAQKTAAETQLIGVQTQVEAVKPHIEMFKLGTTAGSNIPAAGG